MVQKLTGERQYGIIYKSEFHRSYNKEITMKLKERIVNVKRHTVGYVNGSGHRISRSKAVTLAKKDKIDGVRICHGPSGRYLVSTTSTRLYDLPERVEPINARTSR